MDDIDKKILQCLQEDVSMPGAKIAERVNLSSTPCWRRVQKLKNSGIIDQEVALLNRGKLNVNLTAFVAIRTSKHNSKWLKTFAKVIAEIPEIVECYRMSGEVDYMLRVVIPDVSAYDSIYKRLTGGIELQDVTTSFAMEELKYSTQLPLGYI